VRILKTKPLRPTVPYYTVPYRNLRRGIFTATLLATLKPSNVVLKNLCCSILPFRNLSENRSRINRNIDVQFSFEGGMCELHHWLLLGTATLIVVNYAYKKYTVYAIVDKASFVSRSVTCPGRRVSATPKFVPGRSFLQTHTSAKISSTTTTCSNAAFYMFFASVLRYALLVLAPLSLILSSYLYLYPVFHLCAFPSPEQNVGAPYTNTLLQHLPFTSTGTQKIAPFRLLALGDPQLEGDTSIPDPEAATFPNLSKFWKDALLLDGTQHNSLQRLRHSLHDLIDFYLDDIPKALEVYRKRLDHIGNDYYLGHIYRTLHWWTDPTHVTVLGDLVGSQWIDDDEFESRGWRYWNRVFKGGLRVSEELASQPSEDFEDTMILDDDAAAWKRRIINVAGNHDIGYAGDITTERLARFVRVFGKANYELRFQMPVNSTPANGTESEVELEGEVVPELRIVVLNDMNLDTPAYCKELQDETYNFLNKIITTSQDVARPAHFTLVLTHIPMYKKAGICVDGPFFDFHDEESGNGVKEQNHLSGAASKGFLEGIFGMSGDPNAPGQGFGRNGLILTGHDHEGCDVYHYINQSAPPEREWQATRYKDAQATGLEEQVGVPGLREITLRSMMGDFAGNAGLMSLWFDEEVWDWKFEFVNCSLGTQHIWWVVHVLDLVTVGVALAYGVLTVVHKILPVDKASPKSKTAANGTLKGAVRAVIEQDGAMDSGIADFLKTNGKLDVPGAGKKSLRKKKSKRTLNGGSPSPSPSLNSLVVSMS
jgi:hypothetical protein